MSGNPKEGLTSEWISLPYFFLGVDGNHAEGNPDVQSMARLRKRKIHLCCEQKVRLKKKDPVSGSYL